MIKKKILVTQSTRAKFGAGQAGGADNSAWRDDSHLTRKTILVTGGAGFIGSHLIERLIRDEHSVLSLDNYFTGLKENHVPGAEYRVGHTKDIARHVPEKVDLVFHLGEYSRVERSFEDASLVWDLNKAGTLGVLEYCRAHKTKIVYAGSSTKFGDGGLGREESPYAWTKATNTELVVNYGKWFGIPYAVTYFYNVYGPREISEGPYATVLGIFKKQYEQGEPITVVSPGTQRRNFTHVLDIVEGLVRVGESGEGDGFGLGAKDSYSILEIAQMFGGDIQMVPERRGNRMSATLDTRRAEKLGWRAKHDVKDYIRSLIQTV